MPIDTWASLMNHYYKAPEGDIGGDELMRLLTRTSWINDAVNGNGEIETHKISLYRNSYRPKNSTKKHYAFVLHLLERSLELRVQCGISILVMEKTY